MNDRKRRYAAWAREDIERECDRLGEALVEFKAAFPQWRTALRDFRQAELHKRAMRAQEEAQVDLVGDGKEPSDEAEA